LLTGSVEDDIINDRITSQEASARRKALQGVKREERQKRRSEQKLPPQSILQRAGEQARKALQEKAKKAERAKEGKVEDPKKVKKQDATGSKPAPRKKTFKSSEIVSDSDEVGEPKSKSLSHCFITAIC
jgi:hypothetical protein